MIDFRYHLISIVAIFLALGIGILMGSYVLGEGLVKQLRNQFEDLKDLNDELEGDVRDLESQVSNSDRVMQRMRDWVLPGRLEGRTVVVLTYEGTSGSLTDQVTESIEEAGATISSTVSVTDSLSLPSRAARDQLALILSSAASRPDELRAELGERLGEAFTAGDGVRGGLGSDPADGPDERADVEGLIDDLEEAGLVSAERPDDEEPYAPPGSWFVIVGGGEGDAPFRIAEYTVALGVELANAGAPVSVAESADSGWNLTTIMRSDDEAQDLVSTEDQADTVAGSISLVLGLELAADGVVSHSGVGSGAQEVIPEPIQTP
jgi:hypothetical protein